MGGLIADLVETLLQLYMWTIIAMAIMSWLVAFNVVNIRNPFVQQLDRFLTAVTDPALRPIRRIIPIIGGIDISPVVLIFALGFLIEAFHKLVRPMLESSLGY